MQSLFVLSRLSLLSVSEQQSLLAIIFEVCSAFGTTGLSMGITPELTAFGKWVLMILMFIGRIGLVSFFLLLRGKDPDLNYHYPKERIIIGVKEKGIKEIPVYPFFMVNLHLYQHQWSDA